MGDKTAISWTDMTFNPWWGCTKVSEACENCYAESWSRRCGWDVFGSDKPRRFFDGKHWNEPCRWEIKSIDQNIHPRVFCGSMCDVFENRKDLLPFQQQLWDLIDGSALTWLLLTKRSENVGKVMPVPRGAGIGATIELPKYLPRADDIKGHQAKIHFLSLEPLLSPMPTLGEYLDGIDWVIAGCESSSKRRHSKTDWFRSVRDQCLWRGIPFHLKQMEIGGKIVKAPMLDGQQWLEFPEAA